MKSYFANYIILILLVISCGDQKKEITHYGFPKDKNESLSVSLRLPEFKNYGEFIDRISEITCNDSIPKIVIEQKNITRNIYPIEYCEPFIFDPPGKHYVTIRNGKPFEWQTINEIFPDSLSHKLINDFSNYQNSNESGSPSNYFVILESGREEKTRGFEKFISDLTQEYDRLGTDLELNFAFWESIKYLPSPAN
tara:strand:- start:34 stop:618 length:585 start_codon:yes stop_codon:yes gene_type:complete